MARTLPDRRTCLFGREDDLRALLARVGTTGLTAVVGWPQIGKSWLLTELARRLASEVQPRRLVGIAESRGETPDLLLRAIEDLYTRWLEDASFRQQAAMVWKQQRPNLLPGVGKAVGTMIKEAAGAALKPVAVTVREALDGLLAANRDLTTGGLKLPVLQYDQARDLLAAVHAVAGAPLVLILDQWEKSPDVGREAGTLDAFLCHVEEWPPCHMFLAIRTDDPEEHSDTALGKARALIKLRPGRAGMHELGEMRLDGAESHRLAVWVHSTVPAASDEADAGLVELVGGFPGVLMRWSDQRGEMAGRSDLERIAENAHAYRFPELESCLKALKDDTRRLAIRLVLLPQGSGELWSAIKAEVLEGVDEALLDDLCDAKVLEAQDPPDFGHAKRFEAAQAWLFDKRRATCCSEAERLILALGARVENPSDEAALFAFSLATMAPIARELKLPDLPLAVCLAARTLFGTPIDDPTLERGANTATAPEHAPQAPLLAMGLANALDHAKKKGDLARRDVLLSELRQVAEAYPTDAALREPLAKGLANTRVHAKVEGDLARRDALLDKLRELATAHPDGAAVRERLAWSLVNTLNYAKEEGDLARRDALLDELRELAAAYPEDAAVRFALAAGLAQSILDAKGGEPEREAHLLDALRGAPPSMTATA